MASAAIISALMRRLGRFLITLFSVRGDCYIVITKLFPFFNGNLRLSLQRGLHHRASVSNIEGISCIGAAARITRFEASRRDSRILLIDIQSTRVLGIN
jgi:hypothetical protein